MKNIKNKKKIILVLFLICVFGIAGYGVYSYYFVTGTFSNSTYVNIGSFDPRTVINEDTDSFLGSGGEILINCPNLQTGNETIDCVGSITVRNDGSGPINVEVLNVTAGTGESYSEGGEEGAEEPEEPEESDIVASDPILNWSTKTLAAGETAVLNITVPTTVTLDYGSSDPVPYNGDFDPPSEEENNGTVVGQMAITLKLKATQVINNN